MIRRISRFAVALLLLNLSLVGQERACAHETQSVQAPADPPHGAAEPHHQPPPDSPRQEPCDESASQCCDAIASCAISGVPAAASRAAVRSDLHEIIAVHVALSRASAPHEVATPPPRA